MSTTAWLVFAIIGFSLAAACFGVAVVLFVRYKIPDVLGDLTGRRAAKEVAELRGDRQDSKKMTSSGVHTSGFQAMALAHESKRLDVKSEDLEEGNSPTEAFGPDNPNLSGYSGKEATTGVLQEPVQIGITQVLNETGEAIVPVQPATVPQTEDLKRVAKFEIVRSVTEVHTDEYV
ncbi:MAG: hypothetical protein J5643_01540 [Lachnospiraceae bacterium]|nr:hypothetical protein [Lachnospiraceae bacterium]